MDALAGRFGFLPKEVLTLAARYPHARYRNRLAEVIGHVEPLAESVMESRLRMPLVLAGLPRPVAQFPDTGSSWAHTRDCRSGLPRAMDRDRVQRSGSLRTQTSDPGHPPVHSANRPGLDRLPIRGGGCVRLP